MATDYEEIEGATLTEIADAIRYKTGGKALMTPLEMPDQIASIDGETPTCKINTKHDITKVLDTSVVMSHDVSVDSAPNPYCYQVSSSTTLTGTAKVRVGDWILATVTARSAITYPEGWTVLHESKILTYYENHRMAILCKQAEADGVETATVTQASSARLYLNLLVLSGIQGFAYHEGTEVFSNIYKDQIKVTRPQYPALVWCCSAYSWLSDAPYGEWSCDDLPVYCIPQVFAQPRQANFVDEQSEVLERIFIPAANSPHIIDCVEMLK